MTDDPMMLAVRTYKRQVLANGWDGPAHVVLVYVPWENRNSECINALKMLKDKFPDTICIWDIPSWRMLKLSERDYLGFECVFRTQEEQLAAALSMPQFVAN